MWSFELRRHPTARMSRYLSICWASCLSAWWLGDDVARLVINLPLNESPRSFIDARGPSKFKCLLMLQLTTINTSYCIYDYDCLIFDTELPWTRSSEASDNNANQKSISLSPCKIYVTVNELGLYISAYILIAGSGRLVCITSLDLRVDVFSRLGE